MIGCGLPMRSSPLRAPRLALLLALPVLAALLGVLSASCDTRLGGSCKTNADCGKAPDGGPAGICYNLRCLECHYDSDCAPGSVCNGGGQCSRIDERPQKEAPAATAAPAADADAGGGSGGGAPK
jgi:hypothetical protein